MRTPEPYYAAPAAPTRSRAPLLIGAVVVAAAAAVAILLLVPKGGGTGGSGPFGKAPAIQSAYKGPKIELKILFKPGRYVVTETQEGRGTQTVRAGDERQEMKSESSVTVDGEIEIKPPEPGTGERHVVYTCNKVKMTAIQGPQRMSFDSENPQSGSGSAENQMLARMLRPLIGWKGTQVYSADGKFLRLEGLEDLLSEVGAAAGGPQAVAMMKQMLEPLLREILTRHWGKLLPVGAVGPGDSWQRRIDLENFPMFGKVDFDFTCWLTDVEEPPTGKVAVMVCDGNAKVTNRPLDMSSLGLQGAPKTTVDDLTMHMRFTVKFPLDVGLATELNGDAVVEGAMTIQAMGQTAKSTMKQSIKQGYSLRAK
jgi:hypothetical protein